MKNSKHIIRGLLCGACLCLAAACGQIDDGVGPDGCGPAGEEALQREGHMFLSVRIAVGGTEPAVRAVRATGGEDGDGREPGDNNENAVTGVTIFLFGPDADLNTQAGLQAPILGAYYYGYGTAATGERRLEWNGSTESPVYTTSAESVAEYTAISNSCKVLAIVNSDCRGKFTDGAWTTLGDIRDARADGTMPLTADAEDPQNIRKTNFLMTSTGLGEITGIENSNENAPATGSVSVERLMARVDYRTDETTAPNGVFSVTNTEGVVVGQVTITGAVLFNQVEGDVNLLKHVSPTFTETVADATVGRETPQPSGAATNWVIDAIGTTAKTFTHPLSTFTDGQDWENRFTAGVTMNDAHNVAWNCLGYIRENVNLIQSRDELRRYATGVVFQAQYNVESEGFTDGQDLYKWGNTLYPTLEAARTAAGLGNEVTQENCGAYGIAYYPGGICYYTYFIKHADDGQDATFGTMEHAIVRNNLYQLTVTSVSSIGDPEPGDSELTIVVAVRAWQPLPQDDVDLQ